MNTPNLSGLSKAPAKKSSGKTYPILPDPGGIYCEKADQLRPLMEEATRLDGQMKKLKAELTEAARDFFFAYSHNKLEVPSSVEVRGTNGNLLVSFSNSYTALKPDDARIGVLTNLVGEEAAKELLSPSFEIVIHGDRLASLSADAQQDIIDQLVMLMGCHEVPSDAIEAKETVKVIPEFHTKRHRVLEPSKNVSFDDILPGRKAVKRR